jgi:hypothetical protein
MMHEPKETDIHRLASVWEVGRRLVGVCTWHGHSNWQRAKMRGNFSRDSWIAFPSLCRGHRKRKGKLCKRTFSYERSLHLVWLWWGWLIVFCRVRGFFHGGGRIWSIMGEGVPRQRRLLRRVSRRWILWNGFLNSFTKSLVFCTPKGECVSWIYV